MPESADAESFLRALASGADPATDRRADTLPAVAKYYVFISDLGADFATAAGMLQPGFFGTQKACGGRGTRSLFLPELPCFPRIVPFELLRIKILTCFHPIG